MTPITMSREAKGLTVEFIRRLKDIATSPFLFRISFFTSFLSYRKGAKSGRGAMSARRRPRRREFAFPAGDDHAGDAISENGHGRSPHIHELIDGEKEKQRLHGQVKRSGGAEDDQQGRARHARGP